MEERGLSTIKASKAQVFICFIFLFLVYPFGLMNAVEGQPLSTHDISLYAHSSPGGRILNASAPAGPEQCTNANETVTFTLKPVLGASLRFQGTVIVNVELRASGTFSGTVIAAISDKQVDGVVVPVLPANLSQPIVLSNHTQVVSLAGGGSINHLFTAGSMIQLSVIVVSSGSLAQSYLCWDEPPRSTFVPTSIRISVVDPTQTQIEFSTKQPQSGPVVQAETTCACATVDVVVNVTDPIGIYRLVVGVTLTGPNRTLTIQPNYTSTYTSTYSYLASLESGYWHVAANVLDSSGDIDLFYGEIWIAPFRPVLVRVVDQAGDPLEGAAVEVTFKDAVWMAATDVSGSATIDLPTPAIVSPLNLTASWQSVRSVPLQLKNVTSFVVTLPVYNFGVQPLLMGVVPLPFVNVTLLQNNVSAVTNLTGTAPFHRIPAGNYTLRISYLYSTFETKLGVNESVGGSITHVNVPLPVFFSYVAPLLATVVIASVAAVWVKKRSKLTQHDFSYFNQLTSGGLPSACFVVIVGNAGSGKSVLMQTLAAEHLAKGRGCAYLTNTEYPSTVREHMLNLGIPVGSVSQGKLLFIDSYSAVGGIKPTEKFYVSSHTDLTGMAMEVTKCLEELGSGADIYIDSATPMLSSLRADYVLNFLQSVAGKIKATGGKLVITLGTGIDKTDLTKFEETSDCIIETQVQEYRRRQRRRLRVKKLRGKPYVDRWTTFQVEAGKGIIFLTSSKSPS